MFDICTKISATTDGYLYASAKDAIKWAGYKPKKFIQSVMSIGNLVFLSKEDFSKRVIDEAFEEVTVNDLEKLLNG